MITVSKNLPANRQTGRNVLAIWMNRGLAIIAPLIITPIITHRFGLELIGVWLMVTQLTSHLMLLDAGLANSLVRLLAGQQALHDGSGGSKYLATAFYVLAGLGLLLLIGAPLLSAAFVESLHLSAENRPGASALLLIAIASVAVSLPLRVGHGLLASIHRFDRIHLLDSLSIAIKLMLILALFHWLNPTLLQLGLIVFGTSLLSAAAVFLGGIRLNSELSLRPSGFSSSALTELTSMGMAALFVTFASILLMQSSAMLTGYAIGPAAVALIAYPLMIYTSLTPFMQTLSLIITPVAAAMSAKKEELLSIFLMAVRYQASAAFLLLLILVVLGHPLLVLWLSGPRLSPAELRTMSTAVIILFAGYTFSSVAQIGRSILSSVGYHWAVAIVELTTAISGLVFGYFLTNFTQSGVLGMAIGIASVLVLRGLIFYPLMLARYFVTSPAKLVLKSIGLPLTIASATGTIGWIVYRVGLTQLSDKNILWLIVICGLSILIWAYFTWYWVALPAHRALLRAYIMEYGGTKSIVKE